jgi:hypothetical protein
MHARSRTAYGTPQHDAGRRRRGAAACGACGAWSRSCVVWWRNQSWLQCTMRRFTGQLPAEALLARTTNYDNKLELYVQEYAYAQLPSWRSQTFQPRPPTYTRHLQISPRTCASARNYRKSERRRTNRLRSGTVEHSTLCWPSSPEGQHLSGVASHPCAPRAPRTRWHRVAKGPSLNRTRPHPESHSALPHGLRCRSNSPGEKLRRRPARRWAPLVHRQGEPARRRGA